MIKKLKEKWKDWRMKQRPVLFVSIFSYEPIPEQHFSKMREIMSGYCKQHDIEFALFNNALVRPISKQELKQLFEQVYSYKFRGGNNSGRKIKFFNHEKGWGFISGNDGQEYFLHISQLPDGATPEPEDEVKFDTTQTEKGMQAQNITFV